MSLFFDNSHGTISDYTSVLYDMRREPSRCDTTPVTGRCREAVFYMPDGREYEVKFRDNKPVVFKRGKAPR